MELSVTGLNRCHSLMSVATHEHDCVSVLQRSRVHSELSLHGEQPGITNGSSVQEGEEVQEAQEGEDSPVDLSVELLDIDITKVRGGQLVFTSGDGVDEGGTAFFARAERLLLGGTLNELSGHCEWKGGSESQGVGSGLGEEGKGRRVGTKEEVSLYK